jgi:hypothetical protein
MARAACFEVAGQGTGSLPARVLQMGVAEEVPVAKSGNLMNSARFELGCVFCYLGCQAGGEMTILGFLLACAN